MVLTSINKQSAPPYVSYSRFVEFLEVMQHGLPGTVGRATLPDSMGERTQAQLFTGLRFLGLITPFNEPTDRLGELIRSEPVKRASILAEILETKYGLVLGVLADGSDEELEQTMRTYFGTSGDTVRRSAIFLIRAAIDAGLPVSHAILQGRHYRRLYATATFPGIERQTSGSRAESKTRLDVHRGKSAASEREGIQGFDELDPILRGVLENLPEPGPLARETKQKWMNAIEAVFNVVYPTSAEQAAMSA